MTDALSQTEVPDIPVATYIELHFLHPSSQCRWRDTQAFGSRTPEAASGIQSNHDIAIRDLFTSGHDAPIIAIFNSYAKCDKAQGRVR
jgi:hypothetical protein